MNYLRFRLLLLLLTVLRTAPAFAEAALPWEKDYATAAAKAKAEKRPLFLMLTATWCGPCKMLESKTLPDPEIRAGLKEFVWVKAYEDAELNKKFDLGGYPTLVFLDPATDRILARSSGFEPAGPFLRRVIGARKAAGLSLTKKMEGLAAKSFVLDHGKTDALMKSGDFEGLQKYLAPAGDDALREGNFVVAKVSFPPGVGPGDVVTLVSTPDEAVEDLLVPDSGLLLIPIPRETKEAGLNLIIISPGCKVIDEPLKFGPKTAVLARTLKLERLVEKDTATFTGRVLRPDGQPAPKAIVRICDWAVTRADDDGRFRFSRVSPGSFDVRAEYPGGEFQEDIKFAPGKEQQKDLPLKAVTTVGIRWALQQKEGSRELSGDGVRTGEAYFSVAHSRFLLERGAQTRIYWGSDFMLRDDWKGVRQYLEKEQLAALEASNTDGPIFWLFDATGHTTGLHTENARFEDIRAVNDDKPFDAKSYFKFLRGDLVRKGQVYTLRCVRKDCYAKMEIMDVTVVPNQSPK